MPQSHQTAQGNSKEKPPGETNNLPVLPRKPLTPYRERKPLMSRQHFCDHFLSLKISLLHLANPKERPHGRARPDSPGDSAVGVREHEYRPGCGPEPALVSARSRRPAVCSTLPRPSCSPAGSSPEKQHWQHDLQEKGKRRDEQFSVTEPTFRISFVKAKEEPAPFQLLPLLQERRWLCCLDMTGQASSWRTSDKLTAARKHEDTVLWRQGRCQPARFTLSPKAPAAQLQKQI